MITTRRKTMTALGFARLLTRGIEANYTPETKPAEIQRLVEYLQDLAVSRSTDAELPGYGSVDRKQAEQDAEWLDAIACYLEDPQP
jgi:hypothetical protein